MNTESDSGSCPPYDSLPIWITLPNKAMLYESFVSDSGLNFVKCTTSSYFY